MLVPLSGLCLVFVRFDCPQGRNVEPLIYEFVFVGSQILLVEATTILVVSEENSAYDLKIAEPLAMSSKFTAL